MLSPSFRAISGTWWFCSSRRCSVTIFSVGVPFEAEVPELQQQALLQVARGDAGRVEPLDQPQRPLDLGDRPGPHGRQLVERRHQIPVVVQIADDGRADLPHQRVVGLHRQLPHQVVGQRARRREGVLDRRQLLDLPAAPGADSRRRGSRRRNTRSPDRPRCRSCSPAAPASVFSAARRLRPAAAPRSAPPPASGSRPSPGSADPTARASTSAAA